jgi:predicted acyl esterase
MRARLSLAAVVLVGGLLGASVSASEKRGPVAFPAPVPPRNDIVLDNRVPVQMRDGVTLYADVYRPAGEGRYPVLVSRTPYSTERFPAAYEPAVYFARRGYVYVFQDVRGRHESEGEWEPFRNSERDGYDTIEWAARQPWSNGKVAMQGGSYLGQNQWRAAQAAPPSLVTIVPVVASTSIYHDWITLNGGWRLSFNFGWGPVRQESRIMQNPGPHTVEGLRAIHYDAVQKHLPLDTMQQLAGRQAKFYDDWLANPDYNDYWTPLSVEERFDRIAIPVHTIGGWFDIFSQGTLRGYVGMSQRGGSEQARRMSHLVIGPWEHGPSQKSGEIDFGPAANVDILDVQLRWYDYWLKGMDNGLATEPPVKLFVMGRNEWVYEHEYPLARAEYRPLYFVERWPRERERRRRAADLGDAFRRVPERQLSLRPGGPRPLARRQQLLRHADALWAAGPAPHRRAAGRARVHLGPPAGRDRGHRTGEGGALRLVGRGGHRLRREAGGRAPGRRRLQHGGGNRAGPLSRERQSAGAPDAGAGLPLRDRPGGHVGGLSEGSPHPRARDQQPFPAVRPEPEHRRTVRHHERGAACRADDPSRRGASVARPAAGRSAPLARRATGTCRPPRS